MSLRSLISTLASSLSFVLETRKQDPFPALRETFNRYKISIPKGNDLPFLGGAVGYLAYDLGFTLEKKVKNTPKLGLDMPDSSFGFYNHVVEKLPKETEASHLRCERRR